MVGDSTTASTADRLHGVERFIGDVERLYGSLRISIRHTPDGLGVYIPPKRSMALVLFLIVWLGGWAAGERFALLEMWQSGFRLPGLFLLVWIIPWTIGGLAVMWLVLWQLLGTERLFFTAGALVREMSVLGFVRRRVVMAADIRSIAVDNAGNDFAGLGTIKVETTGKRMRIGSGLETHEAEIVAELIRMHVHPAGEKAG